MTKERPLTEAELELMTKLENAEANLGGLLTSIENEMSEHGDREAGRWLSLGRTNLELGIMWTRKAIERPNSGLGRKAPK